MGVGKILLVHTESWHLGDYWGSKAKAEDAGNLTNLWQPELFFVLKDL